MWYIDGWVIVQEIGMEKSNFLSPAGIFTYNFDESIPSGPVHWGLHDNTAM